MRGYARTLVAAGAFFAGAAIIACSALLGFEEIKAGSGSADGSIDGATDGPGTDGGAADGEPGERPARPAGILAGPVLVTTFAGSEDAGYHDDRGTAASFNAPIGVALDVEDGSLVVADSKNHRIRRVSVAGEVETLAGSGVAGSEDGLGENASFNEPHGVALADRSAIGQGAIYVADTGNHRIRRVNRDKVVSTFAGSGAMGYRDDNDPLAAQFVSPEGVSVDSYNVYVADTASHRIRRIKILGASGVSTVGGGYTVFFGPSPGSFVDGSALTSRFNLPTGIVAAQGATLLGEAKLFVADADNNRLRKIEGVDSFFTTTLAGGPAAGFADGTGTGAVFNRPTGVAVDEAGNVFIADATNNRIRKFDTLAQVSTIAGTEAGITSAVDGLGSVATFAFPSGLAVDKDGTTIYVGDTRHNLIRKVFAPQSGGLAVSWKSAPGESLALYRATVGAGPLANKCEAPAGATGCIITGLVSGTTYTVEVVGMNGAVEGPSATTQGVAK